MLHEDPIGIVVDGNPAFIAAVTPMLDRIAADRDAGAVLLRHHARSRIGASPVMAFGQNATEVACYPMRDYRNSAGFGPGWPPA